MDIVDHEKRRKILDEIIKEKNEEENKKNNLNDIDYKNQMINKNEIIDNFFTPK